MPSVGFNPEPFTRRGKLLTLIRLIPFCERNYNLLKLGPKGTGKSHVYAEFSPHGMLISGSEVTAPKMFVSNANGKIGLVGFRPRPRWCSWATPRSRWLTCSSTPGPSPRVRGERSS